MLTGTKIELVASFQVSLTTGGVYTTSLQCPSSRISIGCRVLHSVGVALLFSGLSSAFFCRLSISDRGGEDTLSRLRPRDILKTVTRTMRNHGQPGPVSKQFNDSVAHLSCFMCFNRM